MSLNVIKCPKMSLDERKYLCEVDGLVDGKQYDNSSAESSLVEIRFCFFLVNHCLLKYISTFCMEFPLFMLI